MYKYHLVKFGPNTALAEIQQTFDTLCESGWDFDRVEKVVDYDEMNCYDVQNNLFIFWKPDTSDETSEETTVESFKKKQRSKGLLHS